MAQNQKLAAQTSRGNGGASVRVSPVFNRATADRVQAESDQSNDRPTPLIESAVARVSALAQRVEAITQGVASELARLVPMPEIGSVAYPDGPPGHANDLHARLSVLEGHIEQLGAILSRIREI